MISTYQELEKHCCSIASSYKNSEDFGIYTIIKGDMREFEKNVRLLETSEWHNIIRKITKLLNI